MKTWGGALLVVAATMGAAGCSSSTPRAAPAASVAAPITPAAASTPDAVQTAASSAAATASSGSATAAASGSAAAITGEACQDGQVKLFSATGQGAGGSFYGTATFALVGSKPCTLVGYPGLDVTTPKGVQHAMRMQHVAAGGTSLPMKAVTLTSTDKAYALFGWGETPFGSETSCPKLTKVTITAPGLMASSSVSASTDFSSQLCSAPEISYVTATKQ